jgi:thioredoxin-like negative regulator of GroEL
MLAVASLFVTSCLAIDYGYNSYSDALAQAKNHKQPLLVLVGATWCPACRSMEQHVLPRLSQQGSLAQVNLAKVDADRQPELARQLMRGNAIPQLIVFSQRPDGSWYREQLTGAANEAAVLSLIQRAIRAGGPNDQGQAASAIGY